MSFGHSLKEIRTVAGFKSARSFYDFILQKMEPSFNYSYYTRMESGSVLPSSQVVNEIVRSLAEELGKPLILAWCRDCFPNHSKLFNLEKHDSLSKKNRSQVNRRQKELTLRQVDIITQSFEHYLVFICLTLSRMAVDLEDLKKNFNFPLDKIIDDLRSAKVATLTKDFVAQSSTEARFPVADTKELRDKFQQVEKWNKKIKKEMNFSPIKEKIFIRRTSLRHFELLIGFLDNIDSLIRVSDEVEVVLNDEVLSFEYSLYRGKIPG